MNRARFLSVSTILILMVFSGCNRKKGCIDPNSLQYDSSAQVDDGSCRYEGKIIYWWNQAFLDSCQKHSVFSIKVMQNGQEMDNIQMTNQVWSSAPGCGPLNTLTTRVDLGSNKNLTYTQFQYYFDASATLIATSPSYNISFSGNTCTPCQFIW